MTRPDRAGRRRRLHILALALGLCGVAACQQKMAHQPYYRPLDESAFFEDGRSARPLERGTVSRAQLPDDHPLMTGLSAKGRAAPKKSDLSPEAPLAGAPSDVANYVNEFPFTLTEDDLKRGLERYTIFCTPCHSPLGDGKGKIVERGYLKPTNYHTDIARGFERFRVNGADGTPLLLRDAPVGYYFEVVSRGFGGMPDYSTQIPPADRWRIIAYIKALQLSQAADPGVVPAGQPKATEGKHP
jgi:hypothetical protein